METWIKLINNTTFYVPHRDPFTEATVVYQILKSHKSIKRKNYGKSKKTQLGNHMNKYSILNIVYCFVIHLAVDEFIYNCLN